jgi:hypothetical protein
MGGFIVERYWPGVTEADVRQAAARVRASAGAGVRYLGSILMTGDEVVLFRFDAPGAPQVAASAERAGLRCDRLVPAVFLDGPDPGGPDAGGSDAGGSDAGGSDADLRDPGGPCGRRAQPGT